MDATVLGVLRRHGYVGVNTRSAPGTEDLKAALAKLVADSVTLLPLEAPHSDYDRWATSLAPDVRRAALEICKKRIEWIFFQDFCSYLAVRTQLMDYSKVLPQDKIVDCDISLLRPWRARRARRRRVPRQD